jgi:aminobenzoyl-glutamate utilization protein B
MYANIQKVGMPEWSADDITLAKALQKELKQPERGLNTKVDVMRAPRTETVGGEEGGVGPTGGGSDDIGDISWNVPTIVLRYPANIGGTPGHNWANGIAMATPIAHKGVVAGAKAQALTLLDLMTKPELVKASWDYFKNVQTKDTKYTPLLRPGDKPATFLNEKIMQQYRPEMKKFYYDPSKYDNYLEQLGIKYPTVRK